MHLVRSSLRYTARKHWGQVTRELREVYAAPTAAAARARFDDFAEQWGERYPAMIATWENAWGEFVPFLEFPVELRQGDHPHFVGTFGHTQETPHPLFDGVDPEVSHRIRIGAFQELFPHVPAPPAATLRWAPRGDRRRQLRVGPRHLGRDARGGGVRAPTPWLTAGGCPRTYRGRWPTAPACRRPGGSGS